MPIEDSSILSQNKASLQLLELIANICDQFTLDVKNFTGLIIIGNHLNSGRLDYLNLKILRNWYIVGKF